ncbi:methyltransferase [Parafrankia colletiae]|uniref:Methyltransferase n=1 Tax=Parafrankia colletiae TaxID=573497 RepID=A0A1S1R5R6_9ACTN|nr:methyltransferase [Parafrankia colletiae]MCK9901593.1 methyltransferase [Frankia sp. Cpl3]OHV41089.1 methyltransferase [Parafrankia colletiae]
MFYDTVESTFYAWCVERLLSSAVAAPHLAGGIVELGAGTGLPIIEALSRCEASVPVRGFERDPDSFRVAAHLVAAKGPPGYTVEPGDFFEQALDGPERIAVANPPYLAAPADDTGTPELWGGESGAEVTCRLLSGPYDVLMLMVASIADPLGVIEHARRSGYAVADWSVCPVVFGPHSCRSGVRGRIDELRTEGRAFSTETDYLLAGVTWLRTGTADPGQADVLRRVLTAGAEPGRA